MGGLAQNSRAQWVLRIGVLLAIAGVAFWTLYSLDFFVTGGVDGTVRTYACEICGSLEELVVLAERRLVATRRKLTPEERARLLG